MAATATAQPRPRRPAAKPAARPPRRADPPVARSRPRPVRLLGRGCVWIALVATLLAGIVALNVAALGLNLQLQGLDERKEKLANENAATASEISSLATAGRIEWVARRRLKLTTPKQTTYVPLDRRGSR